MKPFAGAAIADDLQADYHPGPWLFATPLFDVYAGTDTRLQRDVHLRLLIPRLAKNPNVVDRVFSAAVAAGSIRHPNLVTVYDVGAIAGRPCVVTEAVADRLADRRGHLGPEEVRRLAHDCLDALAA